MIRRKLTLVAALVLCFHLLGAQTFATRQLEYLAGLLKCPLPTQSGEFRCPAVGALSLKAEYDTEGVVNHLGFALFTDLLKNQELTKPLYDFQERLFLEVFLQDSEEKAKKLLNEYKVQWTDYLQMPGAGSFFNSMEKSLRIALSDSVEYVLTKDSLTWSSSWKGKTGIFALRFPANFDLITGTDKKEAELRFAKELQSFQCNGTSLPSVNANFGDLQQLNRTNYVLRKDLYFTQTMNNNLYFQILYDRNYPEESIANLFNFPDPQRSKGLDLQIRQTTYGGSSQTYGIKLSDFQCFVNNNDYEIFTGIEKCNSTTAEFTVIYKSRWYNHSHLLYVQTTGDNLFDKTKPLKAAFYTFIPNHNIKNLYREYVKK
jgi:hypothetical protein